LDGENLQRKGMNMDYVVVLMTMLMIAGYAWIVGRALYLDK